MRLALCLIPLLLAGCGSILPQPEPVTLYRLEARLAIPASEARTWQLLVSEPQAPRGLDTDRIAVFPEANVLQYFGQARWISRAPRMIQDRLLDALEDSGGLRAVARSATAVRADLMLSSELRAFQAVYAGGGSGPAEVQVKLLLRLLDPMSNAVVASRSFERRGGNGGRDTLSVVRALDAQLADLLTEAVTWVLAEGDAWQATRGRAQ